MIIDELVVHNFGPFAKRQNIALTPPSNDKPVVLLGGLNGHGKTTLLDAIQLCFYGAFSGIATRNGLSYGDYLAACVHRNSGIKEAAVEVAFRHTINGQENRYRIHRSWRITSSNCKERFDVLKNRRPDVALAENWITEVEDLFPPNIAGLFLFDGEQVEQYATPDSSVDLIGTAIRNLLGLDIVDQLNKDLVIYARRKRMEEKDDPVRPNIDEVETQINMLDEKVTCLNDEKTTLKEETLVALRNRLDGVENEYRRLGGELFEDRVQIETQLSESEEASDNCTELLRSFAAGSLPLLLVQDQLFSIQAQDADEEKSRRAIELASALKVRDDALIQELQKQSLDGSEIELIAKWLYDDRKSQQKLGTCTEILNLSRNSRTDLQSLLNGGIDELGKAVEAELANSSQADARVEHIRQQYESIPGGDLIGEVSRNREILRTEIDMLEAKLSGIEEEIQRLTRQRDRCQDSLIRMLEKDVQAAGIRNDRVRILDHVKRVRGTLHSFRSTVIKRHIEKIASLVLESYQQLLRKSSLVTRLEIDPSSFELTLFGGNDCALGTDRLSAGERQLLAIALLWGLAKASGRALPTAIDTPLGRLDASHRRFLIERYFPFASHQVLLLSTDEEIIGDYFDELLPFVGRCYNLSFDDTTASTTVNTGYFDHQVAH